MVFADVLSDNVVVQVVGTLSYLRSCRDECKAQKKKRAKRLTCNAGRLMRVEQHCSVHLYAENKAGQAHVGDTRRRGLELRGCNIAIPADPLVECGPSGHFALAREGLDLGCA